jgi:uncharacterized membrane protein YkvA (DUF1232 family)
MKLSGEQQTEATQIAARMTERDERKVRKEYAAAEDTARGRGAGHRLLEGIGTLWQMLCDSSYSIPWSTRGLILFALVYFIMPIDAIPDPIPVLGYLDDAAVVGWVVSVIGDDIAAYQKARS